MKADYALSIILLVFSAYFLINECRQLYNNGIEYFKSAWNYVDFVPSILIVIVVIVHFIRGTDAPMEL